MRRDTLTGYLFILVGDENDNFENDFSTVGVPKLIFDTDVFPTDDLIKLNKYRFVTEKLFYEKFLSADYLFKWKDEHLGGSIGINRRDVYNALRQGKMLVCSLDFDVVKSFISVRQLPKKNYILINVSSDGKIPVGFDEFSFDYITNDFKEICEIIERHK